MKKIILLLCFAVSTVFAQQTYLHCGTLFDAKNGKFIKEQTVIVEGDKILQVKKGFLLPSQAEIKVINLKDKTVLPGFIDMHVHIESETNNTSYINRFINNESDIAFDAVMFASRTLLAGFTTVRDMGGTGVNVSLRDAIREGKIPGPRIFTAEKAIGTTGGHADPTNGYRKKLMGNPGPAQGVVNSPEDGKKAVRQRYKNGADCIKITATGGVLSMAKNGQNPQFTLEEIKAIVATANDYGMHVAAHAHGDEGMYRAVMAGVTTIEHGTLMETRTMDLMKEKKAFLVPTITAGKQVAEKAKIKGYFPDVVTPKAIEIGPRIQNTFEKAYRRGVPIAFGTDAGVFPHGLNALEFQYMVEAGMPVVEALQSATITGAKILDSSNELGQLAPGFYADIIATDSNPQKNIKILQAISFVMKGGRIFKQD